MKKRKLILDVDTGTDDAVAIMLAALHPDLDLLGVTTVNGNVEVEYGTNNTLRVLDFIDRSHVPVFQGLNKPMSRADFPIPRALKWNSGVHGNELDLPAPRTQKQDKSAVEFLVETYRATTEPITLVGVAPLSNIATAIAIEPKIIERADELVLMGGAHHVGNTTPCAEMNIWADPDASAAVFRAGFKRLVCVPLDATHQALVSRAVSDALKALGTPAGIAAERFIGRRITAYDANQPMDELGHAPVHDALCIAYLVDPTVITTQFHHVAVETQGELTIGRTVVDIARRGKGEPNCHFAFGADRTKFCNFMLETLSRS